VDLIKDFIFANAASFWAAFIAFGLFVLVIYRFGVKAIIAAVDAREERIRKQVEEADRLNVEAKRLQAELAAKIRTCEEQVTQTLAKSRIEAEQARDALLEKGRAEVEGIRHRALQDIEAARHAAIIGLRAEVAAIATEVAAKIITAKLDDARQDELVRGAIETYEKSGKR
jgi:F-type H+-transporting ATPase subunit b